MEKQYNMSEENKANCKFRLIRVYSHGRFLEPPSRASMWRMGFSSPADYQDHEGNCGGMFHQWMLNGGRCGVCGDKWDVWPRPHEHGGRYASGHIVRRYSQGQVISAVIEVTTAHQGYMQFHICQLSPEQQEATQDCLNKQILMLADGSGSKYTVGNRSEMARIKLQLPELLTCQHCVIQWRYRTGNNWGVCDDGSSRMGCGPQEEFRGCADVSISNDLESDLALIDNDLGSLNTPTSLQKTSERTEKLGGANSVLSAEPTSNDASLSQLGETFERGLAELFSADAVSNNKQQQQQQQQQQDLYQSAVDNDLGSLDIRAENDDLYRFQPKQSDFSNEKVVLPSVDPVRSLTSREKLADMINKLHAQADVHDNMIESSSHNNNNNNRVSSKLVKENQRKAARVELAELNALGGESRVCLAVGIWVTVPGMDSWCENNCADEITGAGCPTGMCRCVKQTSTLTPSAGEKFSTTRIPHKSTTSREAVEHLTAKAQSLVHFKTMPRPTLHIIQHNQPRKSDDTLALKSNESSKKQQSSRDITEETSSVKRSDILSILDELSELRQHKKRQRKIHKLSLTRAATAAEKLQKLAPKKHKYSLRLAENPRSLKKLISGQIRRPQVGDLVDVIEASSSSPNSKTLSAFSIEKSIKAKPSILQSVSSRRHRLLPFGKLRALKHKTIRLKLPRKLSQSPASNQPSPAAQWRTHIHCTGVKQWRYLSGVNRWCRQQCLPTAMSGAQCALTVCVCSRARVSISHPQLLSAHNHSTPVSAHTLLSLTPPPPPSSSSPASSAREHQLSASAPGFLLLLQPLITAKRSGVTPANNNNGGRSVDRYRNQLLRQTMQLLRKRREQQVVVPLTPAPAAALTTTTTTTTRPQQRDNSSDSVNDGGIGCRGVGVWRHSFAIDYWCEVNCRSQQVTNCPNTLCRCRGYAQLNNK